MRGAALHGLPGHPLHPPLTDVTIGMFVLATALAVIGAAGAIEDAAGKGCWLALIGGLAAALPTAATGFADWIRLEWGSAPWRTATLHLTAMLTAVALYAVAAWLQYDGYRHGDIETGGVIFSVAGVVALTAGGWLGGAIIYVASDSEALAWIAFAILLAVALIGFSMLAIWLGQRRAATAGPDATAPAEQRFPTVVVVVHGVLAAVTLVLVLLVAAGVGD